MATPNDPNRDELIRQQAARDASASTASRMGTTVAPGATPYSSQSVVDRLQGRPAAPAPAPAAATPAPAPAAPSPPRAAAPAPAPSPSYFEGSNGQRRRINADGSLTGSAPTKGGVSYVPSSAAAAASPSGYAPGTPNYVREQQAIASGLGPLPNLPSDGTSRAPGGLARRSALEEFQSIREGVAAPRRYDSTNARLTGRRDAFNITNPNSRERELVDLAARVANDSRLKGFAGARNAIIGQIMGQLDAGNAASLEAMQQQGRAGLGMQGFEQDVATQEFSRRGERLRDQFLQEGNERLARLNNDADMLQTALQGEYGLEGARLGASRRSGANPYEKVAEQAFDRGVGDGGDLDGGAIRGLIETDARGIVPSSTTAGTYGINALNRRLASVVAGEDIFDINPDFDPAVTGADAYKIDNPWWTVGDNYRIATEDGGWDIVDPEQVGLTYDEAVRAQAAARRDSEARRRAAETTNPRSNRE